MKLIAPTQSIDFDTLDIHGSRISLRGYRGKAIILSFFRNTACPFCLKRVFELSAQQRRWSKVGVEIIVVFTSPAENVVSFHKNKFERFRVIADPELELYNKYGIEKSASGFFKSLVFKVPTIAKGLALGGKLDKNNPHGAMPVSCTHLTLPTIYSV